MQYRKLGRTGLDVSLISFGSWVTLDYQIGVPEAKAIMQSCYNAGVNFVSWRLLHIQFMHAYSDSSWFTSLLTATHTHVQFDNAEVYAHGESERIMGQALHELGLPRSDIVLSTKVFFGAVKDPRPTAKGLSRKHIIEGVKASLERLRVDHVDVVFAHRPDPSVPMEEVVRAFNWVIDKGWAFYWGTSEWPASSIAEAHVVAAQLGLIPPCAEQPQYSLLHRERVEVEYEPLYSRYGVGLTTFSPLACGLLTGKYSRGDIPVGSRFGVERYKFIADRWLREDALTAAAGLGPIANELGATPAQVALAWCAANPRVSTVLTGATSVKQVEENVAALSLLPELTPERIQRIEQAVGSHPTIAMGKPRTA